MCLCIMACSPSVPQIPTQVTEVATQASIYPDYTDVVIPPNIAPLNFMLTDSTATQVVATLKGNAGESVTAGSDQDGKVIIDTLEWRTLLEANKGKQIQVDVYACTPQGWQHYQPHTLTVASEPIDEYLSYRLIEPGYELYRQLGLYQRHLTNFDEKPIYENNRVYIEEDNHCVNCHNYQNYSTQNMLFHVRANHGGTIFVMDGKARKVQIKADEILTSGVYPSWHPQQNLVAFSTNKTGQTFHLNHSEKLEVIDEGSDLLLYDADKDEVRHILRAPNHMETFPCWTPDGKSLYYCSAQVPDTLASLPDSVATLWYVQNYDSIRYNLMKLDFDAKTRQFTEPQLVLDCQTERHSATLPRISPDGKYLLYGLANYGQFHIWHQSSDLWVMNLQNDSCYALKEANSPDVDSYHSWSSNGRWIVFSSRRMDGNYTRPFIAYFDQKGHAHKAFCLPQQDPEYNILLLKSYNVPELTRDAVRSTPDQLKQVIYNDEGKNAKYIK